MKGLFMLFLFWGKTIGEVLKIKEREAKNEILQISITSEVSVQPVTDISINQLVD